MAAVRERRFQRLADEITTNVGVGEIDKLIALLNDRKTKPANDNCMFLRKLPAEVRNIIYEYVAADAHAEYHKSKQAVPTGNTERRQEEMWQIGRVTNVPGLMGTCRDVFLEFHSIFYSPAYWNVCTIPESGEMRRLKDPILIDTIVNTKHSAHAAYWRSTEDVKAYLDKAYLDKYVSRHEFIDGIVRPSDPTRLATEKEVGFFSIYLRPPFGINGFGTPLDEGSGKLWGCRSFREGVRITEQIPAGEKCSMCLVSHHHRIEQEKRKEAEEQASSTTQWDAGQWIVGVDVGSKVEWEDGEGKVGVYI